MTVIPVNLEHENDEGYKANTNGYIVYLRRDPFNSNDILCTPIENKSGMYQAEITQSGYYKCWTGTSIHNLAEDTSWAGTGQGKYVSISGLNEIWTTNGSNLFPTSTNSSLALGTNDAQGYKFLNNGKALFLDDVVISGGLTSYNYVAISTTGINFTVTGENAKIKASLSITGDSVNPIARNILEVFKNDEFTTPLLSVASGGNVGIKTLNPQSQFSISGNTSITGVLTIDNASGNVSFTNSSGDLIISSLGSGRSIYFRPAGQDRYEATTTSFRPRTSNLMLGENNLLWGDIFSSGTGFINSISAANTVSANNVKVNNQLNIFNSALSQASLSSSTNGRLILQSSSGAYIMKATNNIDNFRFSVGSAQIIISYDGNNNGVTITSNNAIIPNVDNDGDCGGALNRWRNIHASTSAHIGRSILCLSGNICASGSIGIGTFNPNSKLSVLGNASITGILTASTIYTTGNAFIGGDTLRFGARRTITSSSEHGTEGEWCWDENYMYFCVENDVWKRTPHTENSW